MATAELKEVFKTDGPRKVYTTFDLQNEDIVKITVAGYLTNQTTERGFSFDLDKEEFQRWLKAGLRFDEQWCELKK